MISGCQALSVARKSGSRIFSGAATGMLWLAATRRTGEEMFF
jgi:hypothetical protein